MEKRVLEDLKCTPLRLSRWKLEAERRLKILSLTMGDERQVNKSSFFTNPFMEPWKLHETKEEVLHSPALIMETGKQEEQGGSPLFPQPICSANPQASCLPHFQPATFPPRPEEESSSLWNIRKLRTRELHSTSHPRFCR